MARASLWLLVAGCGVVLLTVASWEFSPIHGTSDWTGLRTAIIICLVHIAMAALCWLGSAACGLLCLLDRPHVLSWVILEFWLLTLLAVAFAEGLSVVT